jgi:hypothetical protein
MLKRTSLIKILKYNNGKTIDNINDWFAVKYGHSSIILYLFCKTPQLFCRCTFENSLFIDDKRPYYMILSITNTQTYKNLLLIHIDTIFSRMFVILIYLLPSFLRYYVINILNIIPWYCIQFYYYFMKKFR